MGRIHMSFILLRLFVVFSLLLPQIAGGREERDDRQQELAKAKARDGHAEKARGALVRAARRFGEAALLNPQHAGYWNNLGRAYLDLGLLPDALRFFRASLKLEPTSTRILNNMQRLKEAVLYDHPLYEQGEEEPDEDVNDDSNDAQLAIVQPVRGESRGAVALRAAAAKVTDDAIAASIEISKSQGRDDVLDGYDEGVVLAAFERAVELVPDSSRHHMNLGVAQMRMNRLREARLSFLRAEALVPGEGTQLNIQLMGNFAALRSQEARSVAAPLPGSVLGDAMRPGGRRVLRLVSQELKEHTVEEVEVTDTEVVTVTTEVVQVSAEKEGLEGDVSATAMAEKEEERMRRRRRRRRRDGGDGSDGAGECHQGMPCEELLQGTIEEGAEEAAAAATEEALRRSEFVVDPSEPLGLSIALDATVWAVREGGQMHRLSGERRERRRQERRQRREQQQQHGHHHTGDGIVPRDDEDVEEQEADDDDDDEEEEELLKAGDRIVAAGRRRESVVELSTRAELEVIMEEYREEKEYGDEAGGDEGDFFIVISHATMTREVAAQQQQQQRPANTDTPTI
jgi:Flp pilus assembly protein TadD